ncbi:MAG: hypothetical protein C0432_04175 [Candidatus Puniceispirillum sp.]|nr:hypothetical protein [Candidatus Pelagibacter sp.]MBA4283472.1 hypothetical protein [Candidatus Puniceispirillum sp.]
MAKKININPQILWHEGMLLSPHHFQQFELRFNQLLGSQKFATSPYAWGVIRMSIDRTKIQDGVFSIAELEAYLPDGTFIQYSSSDHRLKALEIDLKETAKHASSETHNLYLCLALNDAVYTEKSRYYPIEGIDVQDYSMPDNIVAVTQLFPSLSLVVSEYLPVGFTGFKLASLDLRDQFSYDEYIPPCVYLSKEMIVWKKAQALSSKMREKALMLAGVCGSFQMTPMLTETEKLLRPLVSALPLIESVLLNDYVSPYALYQSFVQILSHLNVLNLTQVPSIVPIYDHENLLATFDPLIDTIDSLLDRIEQSYFTFPFSKKERLFYLNLNKGHIQNSLYIGVRVPKGVASKVVETWMMESVIVSDFAIDYTRSRRIIGATRRRIDEETALEMMPARDVLVFEIPFDREFIAVNQNLNIFNPNDADDKRPLEMTLYVKKAEILNVRVAF